MFSINKIIAMGNALLTFTIDENTSPLDVIEDGLNHPYASSSLLRATGIFQIEQIVELIGYFSAVILIMSTLFLLYFVNYQRYVSDAKQKIVYLLMTVGTISAYTFIADIVIQIIMDAFL